MFRIYELDIILNEIPFKEVWIDPHYEVKHKNSIDDDLIINLLLQINNESFTAVDESIGFQYFKIDIEHHKKLYRLILVIPLDKSYIGVRNMYRRSK